MVTTADIQAYTNLAQAGKPGNIAFLGGTALFSPHQEDRSNIFLFLFPAGFVFFHSEGEGG